MRVLLVGLLLLVSVSSFGALSVQNRDTNKDVTFNIQTLSAVTVNASALNEMLGCEYTIQNIATGNLWVWFDTTVTVNHGFELDGRTSTTPGGIMSGTGNPKLYFYSVDGTIIALSKKEVL